MPREKDPFWKYVTLLNENNSKWRCNFCGQENRGGATRIKAHLAGIARFGIKGCERVGVDVKTEAREVLMPKNVMDSSNQGVPEERIRENFRAALTSTSHPPNVEGATNLQFPQGVPPLTPHTRELMEQMVLEERVVNVTNFPLGGATSYPSASSPPNSFFPDSSSQWLPFYNEPLTLNAQQNPSAPLPSQNRQLLYNTYQNESRGSILPGPIASDAQLTNMATTNTPQHFAQPDQTFHGQWGRGTGLSPPRASMDMEPPIPSQTFNRPPIIEPFNPPPQIPDDFINTTGPSTSEGNSNLDCNQPRISSVTRVTETVPHSNQPLPSCNEECGTETSSFPLGESRAICPVTALRPTGRPHIEETLVNLQVLENGANMAGPSPSQMQLALVPPRCDKEDGNDTRLFPRQTRMDIDPPIAPPRTSDSPIIEATTVNSQVPVVATNSTGPSSSQDMNRGSPDMNVRSIYANDEEIRNLKRKVEELDNKEVDIKERMEIEFAASPVRKKPKILVERWLKETKRARNNFQIIGQTDAETLPPKEQWETLTREVEELIEQTLPQTLLMENRDAKGVKFFVRKLTGEVIHENIELIWDRLKENHACKLGIYGMGGVGKTTIMMHIYNRLLKDATFDGVVIFTTVSQDLSIYKLQSDIWKALKLDPMEDEHEKKRASMLSEQLERKKNCVLILDDVWQRLDLEEVGIPVGADGFKLVLTTRSFDVCRQMQCQEKIKINPLSQEEAESLFMEEFGCEVTVNLEIKAVVKSIVRECAGLPIGVITMARSMRGVTHLFEWKDSLVKLKDSSKGQTDMEKVLMNLKFSYDRLGNADVQRCFLSCALYPEDELIDKVKLVEFFIDQGLIGELDTRKEQFDRGLTILNKLENVCLLEKEPDQSMIYDRERLKMHDLIRDMALYILSATSIVKPGKGLMRIPPEECWTGALEKVSLMENKISEIPLDMSPNCPKLSTLLFNGSLLEDVIIPDSFFRQLWGLKVLNLSGCDLRELPNSISDLVNLRALLLSRCSELRRIPYLGKLASLRKLDVSGCFSLDALEGLEKLKNLRYLNLTKTRIERLPKGILNHLLNLQLLEVPAVIEEEDIAKLVALETFKCYLKNVDDFNKCVRFIEQSDNPRYYYLKYGLDYSSLGYRESIKSEFIVEGSDDARFGARFGDLGRSVSIGGWGHAIVSVGGECAGIFILVPRDVQDLRMEHCDGITSLSGMGPLEHLEEPEIGNWENLGVLCGGKDEEEIDIRDSPAPTPTPLLFPSLRVLKIYECPKLKNLFGHGSISNLPHLRRIHIDKCEEMVGIIAAVTSPPPHPLPAFPSLENISIDGCDKMKRVVESEWMPHFPNLRRIKVEDCVKMEEIIGGPPPHALIEKISLESLEVENCDNMRNLFPHELLLHLRNLQSIEVESCKGIVEMISGAGQGQGSIMTPVNNTPSSFQSSISLPNLKHLYLNDLPQLKSICEVPISCGSMDNLIVYLCPELKAIPLQLRLRDIDIKELPCIWVEDEEKWKTLMWDDPNAQAILQPYLRKGIYSPDDIDLYTKRKDLPRLCS